MTLISITSLTKEPKITTKNKYKYKKIEKNITIW